MIALVFASTCRHTIRQSFRVGRPWLVEYARHVLWLIRNNTRTITSGPRRFVLQRSEFRRLGYCIVIVV